MEKGNSSNSNNPKPKKYPNATTDKLVFTEYWPSFYHCPTNRSDIENEHFSATCLKCYQSFQYNINEETEWIPLELHYEWHKSGEKESEQEYLKRRERERQPKNYDWYKDYYKEPKPINLQNSGGHFLTRHKPTHYTVYETIYEFRGDHTVSCKSCGQFLNYKENLLREHYDDHQRQTEDEKRARDIETSRIIKEREEEKYREKKQREEEAMKKLDKQLEISLRKYRKREEERRIAATKMAEIEQQEADAAFWNEAAQMADNAGVSQQQQKEEEDENPWWDEILQYADSQDL